MRIKVARYWDNLRTSYWFLPSLMSVGAAILSEVAIWLDETVGHRIPLDAWWIFGGGPDGARATLAAIAGSMISVASLVFSITIVSLTLASGQFGPRLLRNFMRDRANQIVLGTFISTFIFALLVLRAVRSVEEMAFVPQIAVTIAVGLVIASVAVLIFFIHHIATSIQADSVIQSAARQLCDSIDRLFPSPAPAPSAPEEALVAAHRVPDEDLTPVPSGRGDYVQAIDVDGLLRLAAERDLVIRLHRRPGDFVMEGATLASIHARGERAEEVVVGMVRESVVLGTHRTLTQDAEFGFLQLVEIAVRALSPGINDPFTAITCIDRLCSSLARVATRAFPPARLTDGDGRVRVVLDVTSFEGFANSTFNQIRQNAGGSVAVLIRMLEGIAGIAPVVSHPERRKVLETHARMILEEGERSLESPPDLADLRTSHAAALGALRLATGASAAPQSAGVG